MIKKLIDVLKSSQLDTSNELPNGIYTSIGSRMERVYQVVKIRTIGIARSLYNNPEVLVFDESTSSLDSKTERNFIYKLLESYKEKTIIIVSHRLTSKIL